MSTWNKRINARTPRPGDRRAIAAVVPLAARAPRWCEARRVALLTTFWRIADLAHLWRERARSRRRLLQLADDLLKDIGVSRADVHREAMKPFWR